MKFLFAGFLFFLNSFALISNPNCCYINNSSTNSTESFSSEENLFVSFLAINSDLVSELNESTIDENTDKIKESFKLSQTKDKKNK